MNCLVCGAVMDVERNVNGPTGMAEAMGGGKHLHDAFSCPNAQEGWHRQALMLRKEAQETASARLKRSLLAEADDICAAKKATMLKYENHQRGGAQ
jgi:hypothetical protein